MQPTEINLGHGVTSGDMWKLTYEYGELETNGTVSTSKNTGNIARQTISFSGLGQPFVQSYKYDSLYRLTEAKEVSGTNSTSKEWGQTCDYAILSRYSPHTLCFFAVKLAALEHMPDLVVSLIVILYVTGQHTLHRAANRLRPPFDQ